MTMEKPVLVITGASSGIGAATARLLINDYRLVLLARREERLRDLCAALGADARYIVADLGDRSCWQAVAGHINACFGQVDKVLHNAGKFIVEPQAELKQADLDSLWELNVTAVFMLTTYLLPFLRASSSGHILSISSIAAESAFPDCGAYSASKAAIEAWSRCLREELRADKIRVTVVAPGATSTEIWGEDSPFDPEKMATAEDVALTIQTCLSVSERASVDKITVMPSGGTF